ncbi:MAG: TerB family tellurite resistance protein [Acidobacteriota bacterium]
MSILRFLGLQGEEASDDSTETVRKIVQALDQMEPQQARYIAAFAYILGRVAHADLTISEDETGEMEQIVMKYGRLPEEQAIVVVQIAKTQNLLFGHTENYLVTRQFNEIADRKQKLDLLRCLFAVSASDQDVSGAEDREIRQVASELKLTHRDFIAVRSSYRHHLSVLKKPEDPRQK